VRTPDVARLALAAGVLVGAANAASARYEGDFNLFAGQKWLTSGDWAPVEQQRQFGLMLAFGEERAAVHFAIDVFYASDDLGEVTVPPDALIGGSSTEFAIGVRKTWVHGATRPHLGAGANVIGVSEDRRVGLDGTVTNEDRGYGVWVDGGVSWRVATHLNLGIEARFSSVRAELGEGTFPRDVAAGGFHVGLVVGYGW